MTPPHHSWVRLVDLEPDRDPRATVIVLVLPHWQDSQVRLSNGALLPPPTLAITNPIAYSVAYALAVAENEKTVAQLDREMGCGSVTNRWDMDGDGRATSSDFYLFLQLWNDAAKGANP